MPLRELAVALAVARSRDIDLVGPKGYIHGWIHVGAPGAGIKVRRSRYGTKSRRGIVRTPSVTRSKAKPQTRTAIDQFNSKMSRASDSQLREMAKGNNAEAVRAAQMLHGNTVEKIVALRKQHYPEETNTAETRRIIGQMTPAERKAELQRLQSMGQSDAQRQAAEYAASLGPYVRPDAQHSVKKRGENYHVIKTEHGKSTTVAKYKTATEAHAHMAREKSRSQAGMQPSNARPDWAAELDAKARQDQANMQARPPAASGTTLVKGTRHDGTPKTDVHINGEKAGHVYAGESRTPVHAAGSRIASGYTVRKGYYAHLQRDLGGTDSIGHFKTKAEAVRAIESAHAIKTRRSHPPIASGTDSLGPNGVNAATLAQFNSYSTADLESQLTRLRSSSKPGATQAINYIEAILKKREIKRASGDRSPIPGNKYSEHPKIYSDTTREALQAHLDKILRNQSASQRDNPRYVAEVRRLRKQIAARS